MEAPLYLWPNFKKTFRKLKKQLKSSKIFDEFIKMAGVKRIKSQDICLDHHVLSLCHLGSQGQGQQSLSPAPKSNCPKEISKPNMSDVPVICER